MILRQSASSNSGCGSCSLCKMRLVCADSPYCFVRAQNNKSEQQIDTNTIMNGLNIIASALDKQGSILSEFNQQIKFIQESVEKNQNNIDSIINIMDKGETHSNYDDVNNELVESSMIPYSDIPENNTILTEKKTIFGKTKWVPDKKKK